MGIYGYQKHNFEIGTKTLHLSAFSALFTAVL